MKRKLRGVKRRDIQLDYDLYRVQVPIRGVADANLSVLDLWPQDATETILFQHGYAGVLESWEFQINHFARHHRVVAPDLRGHGQSDAPYTQYTMPELVDDLDSIVQHLDLPQRFTLVAHSFGGSVAIEYTNAYPERIDKLVLIATAGEYPLPVVAKIISKIPLSLIRPFWKYRPRWDAALHVMKRMMLNNVSQWQGWKQMANIQIPTLVITGERDSYFPRYVFEQVSETIPDAEVYDVGGAKHKVQLERHNAVNRAIERFVTESSQTSWRIQDSNLGSSQDTVRSRIWLNNYSPSTPPTVPIPDRPLTDFLESAADWLPKNVATLFYDAKLTYQQLNQQVNQFAHVLHGMGVTSGDRVMVVLPNMPQMLIAYYATLKIGGVVVLPNPDADATLIAKQVAQTQSKVLVTLDSFRPLAQKIKGETAVEQVIFADLRSAVSNSVYKKLMSRWRITAESQHATQQPSLNQNSSENGQLMAELIKDAPITPPNVVVQSQDLAVIIFTSGTVDLPKGVCLTHRNLVANTLQVRHWVTDMQYGKETCLAVIPLLHSYGMTNAMNLPIFMGATVVLMPVFDVTEVLEHIKRYRPTLFPGVPSMYMALNQAPAVRDYGLSSIKACISGASSLPIEVQETFEKLTRGNLVEGYGLTEASPVTHANPLEGRRVAGSIGIPLPNTDAQIVDLITGEVLPPGKIGELMVKGPQVMAGYWQSDGTIDTAEVIRDDWLYTGDVAVCDHDGYFQIISRKQDTIVFGEYNVYPRDVEEVLYENNKVLEVAVVGVGHLDEGDGGHLDGETEPRVKAFVVPRPGTELTSQELLNLCRKRLEPYAVPWEIEFREQLPKSFVGKVLRRLLIENE